MSQCFDPSEFEPVEFDVCAPWTLAPPTYQAVISGTTYDVDYIRITEAIREPTEIEVDLARDVSLTSGGRFTVNRRGFNYANKRFIINKAHSRKVGGRWYTTLQGFDGFGVFYHEILNETTYTNLSVERILNTMLAGDGDPNPSDVTKGMISIFNRGLTTHSYAEGNQDGVQSLDSTAVRTAFGQGFDSLFGSAQTISAVRFYLRKVGTPPGNMTAGIWTQTGGKTTPVTGGSRPTGVAEYVSGTILATSLTTTFALVTFVFQPQVNIIAGDDFCIGLRYSDAGSDASNRVQIGIDTSAPTALGDGWSGVEAANTTWSSAQSQDAIYGIDYLADRFTYPAKDQTRAAFLLELAEQVRAEPLMRSTPPGYTDDILDFLTQTGVDRGATPATGWSTVTLNDVRLGPAIEFDEFDWLQEVDKIRYVYSAGASSRGTGSKRALLRRKDITTESTLQGVADQIIALRGGANGLEVIQCQLKDEDPFSPLLALGDTVLLNVTGRSRLVNTDFRIVKMQREYHTGDTEKVQLWLANAVLFELERDLALKLRALEFAD